MFKNILKILAVLIVVFVVVVALQPDDYKIERTTTIAAPASAIFPYVNNQAKWQEWSPWAKMDPEAKFAFEGPKAGVGSIAKWEGKKIGQGTSTITESVPGKHVTFKLDFVKPFEGTSDSKITFTPEGKATNVTWSMEGKQNFIGKAMSLVMDCTEQFDEGLANLKAIAEKK